MNPQYIAAGFIHTIPEKLVEYLIHPFTNIFVIIALIAMCANVYMLRKLRKIKKRDYIELGNIITVGIYIVFAVISAVLVSRLGPHGNLYVDECDLKYMFIPRLLFSIIAVINVIYFIINIITKLKKDKEYKETMGRGYFAEENDKDVKRIDMSSFVDNIKEKIDIDEIKDKVNNITEDIKDMINNKRNKDE